MAMWTEDDEAKKKGVEKGNNNESEIGPSESENEEEEGYSSDMDLRKMKMPSKRWSKDARRKSNKGYSTPDDNRGRESEEEEMKETELEREGNLGRRGMTVLAVWRLVQKKTQGQGHKGGRKSRNVYTLGFYGNLDIYKNKLFCYVNYCIAQEYSVSRPNA
jgi:hypothetical protein